MRWREWGWLRIAAMAILIVSFTAGCADSSDRDPLIEASERVATNLKGLERAEASYWRQHRRYSDDCAELRSYDAAYGEAVTYSPELAGCRLRLVTKGHGYEAKVTIGAFARRTPQHFQVRVIRGHPIERTCQAEIRLGCRDGGWTMSGLDMGSG